MSNLRHTNSREQRSRLVSKLGMRSGFRSVLQSPKAGD